MSDEPIVPTYQLDFDSVFRWWIIAILIPIVRSNNPKYADQVIEFIEPNIGPVLRDLNYTVDHSVIDKMLLACRSFGMQILYRLYTPEIPDAEFTTNLLHTLRAEISIIQYPTPLKDFVDQTDDYTGNLLAPFLLSDDLISIWSDRSADDISDIVPGCIKVCLPKMAYAFTKSSSINSILTNAVLCAGIPSITPEMFDLIPLKEENQSTPEGVRKMLGATLQLLTQRAPQKFLAN